jgi:hypothetical protein
VSIRGLVCSISMAESPFREQRLSPADVRRIITRALELAPLHDPQAASGQALTRAEVEQRAADLGIPVAAVRHALESPSPAGGPPTSAGTASHIVHDEELDGELTVDGHEQVAEALQIAMQGHPGRLEVVGRKLTYNANAYGAGVTLTVHTKNRRTRVRVEQAVVRRWAVPLVTSLLAPMVLAPLAAAAFAATRSVAFAAIVAAVALVAAHLGVRALFARASRKREAVAERAAVAVVAVVKEALAKPAPGARIDVPSAVPLAAVDGSGDEDGEAEVDAAQESAAASSVKAAVRRAR